MGTFTFKWSHPDATDVYVTGTFDNWSKSEKLEKKGGHFEKTVFLPDASEKIYYKFVVDGTWCTDHTAPQENDPEGNLNNYLTPAQIEKHTPATAGIMSSAAPGSSTHELARDVPASQGLPGAFPETPATEPTSFSVNPIPATEGAGNPVHLAPGEKVPEPHTLTSSTISSTVEEDEELKKSADEPEQTFSVAPIPATAGPGNPVQLAPGAIIPPHSEVTGHTLDSNVHTDKASYEAADAQPPHLPPVVTPDAERNERGTGVFGAPIAVGGLIPESSLPMGSNGPHGLEDAGPFMQSAGAQSTTAQLAANVPYESKGPEVPDIVKESQKEADVDPEASAVPEEVKEKAEVEKELLEKVPTAPATSDDTTAAAHSAATAVAETGAAIGGAALAIGGAVAAYAVTAKDKAAEAVTQASQSDAAKTATQYVIGGGQYVSATAAATTQKAAEALNGAKDSVAATAASTTETAGNALSATKDNAAGLAATAQESATSTLYGAKDKVASATGYGVPTVAETVPEPVKESIVQAGESPEAAALEEPVAEKSAVERELLSVIKPEQAHGEPAPKIDGAAAAPAINEHSEPAAAVPEAVKESIADAHASPEAAANPEAVAEKKALEKELLSEIKPEQGTGEPAPKIAAAAPVAGVLAPSQDVTPVPPVPDLDIAGPPAATLSPPVTTPMIDSRDISPTTVPGSHSHNASAPVPAAAVAPVVTTGVASAKTTPFSTAPTTPAKQAITPGSSAGNTPTGGDKKKKNRMSGFFSKIKEKLK